MFNDYNRSQFERMRNALYAYKASMITLSQLISTLEFLYYSCEGLGIELGLNFTNEFATLESIDYGPPSNSPELPTEEIQIIIKESIANLSDLINHRLNNCQSEDVLIE